MDLAGEMLLEQLAGDSSLGLTPARICPPFRRRLTRLPPLSDRGGAVNADRLLNRLWDYPRYVHSIRQRFDLFHVVDHSYSQLVHALPADRTGVYCHDLDTFRCLVRPDLEPRPAWFRRMGRHILAGMQKAAVVFHSTLAVREQIVHSGWIDPSRLVHAPYGTSIEFTSVAPEVEPAEDLLASSAISGHPLVLHVGSCIARKRIDVLLEVFSEVSQVRPELRLVQVGGTWTTEQVKQIARLEIGHRIVQFRGLTRRQIASLYRRAALVLQPSEAEGFGLPVIEALACGAIVAASDIPVLREVGGPAAIYSPVGHVDQWVAAALQLLNDFSAAPLLPVRLDWASRYTWQAHARTIANSYLQLLS
ncbi:glycosyltransferase [Humisphaera borealis]|uniref:Glycosyltransferase n=2 Tax=Humisphaera borealis TaxID=2807512 RepID=A0A7M2X3I3_9BACT|nr:glycosyltransferase [Humisphaera borealis]